MAKNWYPVIDILTCMECGTCIRFCPHGVYDKRKAPVPVVVNPDGCIGHCRGCQTKCPAGAIPADKPMATDKSKCISCMRCVSICPVHARKVSSVMTALAAAAIKKACSVDKANELLI